MLDHPLQDVKTVLMWHRMFLKLKKTLDGPEPTDSVACVTLLNKRSKAGMNHVVGDINNV